MSSSVPYALDPSSYAHGGDKLNQNFAYHDTEISSLQSSVSTLNTSVSTLNTQVAIAPTLAVKLTGVSLDATGDLGHVAVPTLPSGFTRFLLAHVYVDNASHTLATAKVGLYTAASAGGTALLANTSEAIESVTATSDATAANMVDLAPAAISCLVANTPDVYINAGTSEGTAATADFTFIFQPLP